MEETEARRGQPRKSHEVWGGARLGNGPRPADPIDEKKTRQISTAVQIKTRSKYHSLVRGSQISRSPRNTSNYTPAVPLQRLRSGARANSLTGILSQFCRRLRTSCQHQDEL